MSKPSDKERETAICWAHYQGYRYQPVYFINDRWGGYWQTGGSLYGPYNFRVD